MKIRVFLFGALVAAAGVPARADDLTIGGKTTSPVTTASASNSTPGNITITSGGSVEINTAGAAVTINSSNTVSNSGTISNSVGTNGVGVLIVPGNTGSFTHIGTLNIGSTNTVQLAGQYGVQVINGASVSFTGTASGANLTASSVNGLIAVGDVITGTNIPTGTYIVSQTSGTPGGAGVYVLSDSPSFTAAVSGTNLTVSNVNGVIAPGDVITGTNIPSGTTIVSQTSGTTGGAGVYVTSKATTATNVTATVTPPSFTTKETVTGSGATFTGTGSGTSLTVSSVSGLISPGDLVSGTGVPYGTTIVSQTSGTAGGAGIYVTNQSTSASAVSLTASVNPGPFTGNIVSNAGSTMNVFGFGADAIVIQSELKGNITNAGTITATGSTAGGILTTAPVDGAITNTGTIQTTNGVCITTCLQNAITTAGVHLTTAVSSKTTNNIAGAATNGATVNLASGWAIGVGNSVGGGILNAGPLNSTDKTPVATLLTIGSSPTLIVAPTVNSDATSVSVGILSDSTNPGYSIINRGNIIANGEQPTVSPLAIQIGNGSGDTSELSTTLAGGLYNSGTISSLATSQSINLGVLQQTATAATAIVIGPGATLPTITNAPTGTISATTGGPQGGNATAISIATGPTTTTPVYAASVQSLNNAGVIAASANVDTTSPSFSTVTSLSAYAIQDLTGTLANVTNSGTISATATILDNNAQVTVAADLSAATAPVTFNNSGTVVGSIFFGSGTGNQLTIAGPNASVAGQISAAGLGTVNIAISPGGTGGMLQTSSIVNAGSLTVGPGGTLNIGIGTSPIVIAASGPVSFDAASHIQLTPISLLPTATNITLIQSQTSLNFGNFAATTATANIPYLFTGSLSSNGQTLTLSLQEKTASQLGLTGNLAAVYQPALYAALRDVQIGAALGGLGNQAAVEDALQQLLPTNDTAKEAMAELLTDSNTDTIGQRQRSLTMEPPSDSSFNPWFQGLYDQLNNTSSAGYSGRGGGAVLGIDYSEPGLGHLGVAVTFDQTSIQEKNPNTTTSNAQWYLISPYLGFRAQNFFVSAQFNAGASQSEDQRIINIGTASRIVTSNPTVALASGGITGGYIFNLGFLQLAPQASVNGLALFDQNYVEQGGGAGVDLTVASHSQNSARGFIGLGASGNYELFGVRFVPQVLGGWGHELGGGASSITAGFSSVPLSEFTISAPGLDRSQISGSASLDFVIGKFSVGLSYDAISTANGLSQNGIITLGTRF